MKAPDFWWRPPGIAAALLRPAASIYGAIATRRLGHPSRHVDVPVVCVGNVTVGGSGKTPSAIAIAALAREAGRQPGFLLRGYRGRLAGPVFVDGNQHDAKDVGDEALLLARHGPTAVARDRYAGATLLAENGIDLIVMDDGLQNPALRKDLRLAVFDGAVGWGNGCVLPAGPLRAPLDAQWPLLDAVLIVGQRHAGEAVATEAERRGKPVLRAQIEPDQQIATSLRGARLLAFAGIGRPEKFFETLRALGADLVGTRAFGDHEPLNRQDLTTLATKARGSGSRLVTTEKDAVRLGPLAREFGVATLPVRLVFEDPASAAALLRPLFVSRTAV